MDAKTIRKIIADLNDRQSHLRARLRRISDERADIHIEMAQNERALWQWYEALEETEGERLDGTT